MQTLRRIVVGTDFSECAERALNTAIMLANGVLARITVVHVCEPDDDLDDTLLEQRSEALARVVASHQHRGIEVTGVLRSGKPWEKLSNVAAEVGATLIVIGRHGRGRGRERELGSVADHLVRSSSRAVLLVACDVANIVRAAGARGAASPRAGRTAC